MQWYHPAALCLSLASATAAQEPVAPRAHVEEADTSARPADDAVEALIESLASAHRVRDAEDVESFVGKLEITGTQQDDRITVTLDVRFQLDPVRMRYKVDENGRRVERGRDRRGPWARLGDDVDVSLKEAEYEGDKKELYKHVALARQLLRFLDPGEVARAFEGESELGEEKLRVTRTKSVDCRTLTGVIPAFPIYTVGGDPRRAAVKLWIEDDTDRLIAVRAQPVDADDEPTAVAELVSIREHKELDGVLVPTVLLFDHVTPDGARHPAAKVRMLALELGVELAGDQFDRKVPW